MPPSKQSAPCPAAASCARTAVGMRSSSTCNAGAGRRGDCKQRVRGRGKGLHLHRSRSRDEDDHRYRCQLHLDVAAASPPGCVVSSLTCVDVLGDPRTAAQRTDAVESTDLCTAKDRVGAQITLEKPGCGALSHARGTQRQKHSFQRFVSDLGHPHVESAKPSRSIYHTLHIRFTTQIR